MIGGGLALVNPEQLNSRLAALVFGLIIGLPAGLAGLMLARQDSIKFSASMLRKQKRWSWQRLLLGAVVGLLVGLVIAIPTGESIPLRTIEFGIPIGLFFALLLGRESVETSQSQHESFRKVRHAARQSFRIGGIVALTIVINAILVSIIGKEDIVPLLAFALLIAGPIGLTAGLAFDGTAVMQHSILRVILSSRGFIPWALTDFLDYAVDRIFLRKVGGGYVFIHQWLLAYFADYNTDFQQSRRSTVNKIGEI